MTTVVAAARDGIVVMAADTCTNVYDRPVFDSATKVLRVDDSALVGLAGDGALAGVFTENLQLPDWRPTDDLNHWANAVAKICTDLAMELGLSDKDTGRMDATLLLGFKGQLWTVTHHYAIHHPDGVGAIGSGEGPAIGALDAFLSMDVDLIEAVTKAALIAVDRDRYSRGPVQVEVLSPQ